ncbi:MAG: hypothetical protein A2W91_11130 [Bacteroidetes bacterium GWF2_38_335]|nr:MAG: hypothetical protein A2W91_11130 [Bacteroidetes bacterium GWF2_38_335]OFY81748.1 MAG: hypothetical protein A2281_05910 [Bacteroidetes bacterium RIFOXYA12_FULL_38_20]HBS87815.1 hypothetical protein [Bacteroidales bacterium]
MIPDFLSYKVKVKPQIYTTKQGMLYENMASISFYDEYKREVHYQELAYIDVEDIYILIDNKLTVNLDDCYIENFSLKSYRKSRGLEPEAKVIIHNFSAKGTIFDSKIETDFYHADFDDHDISFKEAAFISGRVNFHGSALHDGNVDFTYTQFFNGNFNFSNTTAGKGKIDFKNATFKNGVKDFQYAAFGDGDVIFTNTEFGIGDVSFINADFGDGNVSFKVARFGKGNIEFHFSKFGAGEISFERAEFGDGKVDFRKVEFSDGKVNFNRAIFGDGEVTFEGSALNNSKMTFKKTIFGFGHIRFEEVEYMEAELIFDNTTFGKGNVYFGKSHFKKLDIVSCHLNAYFDLRVSHCSYLDLSDNIIRDIVDFTPYDHPVDIKILNLSGVRMIGHIYIDWDKNNVEKIINQQKFTDHNQKAEQFRVLKENFGKTGNYNYEDLAYIQFKRNEQKGTLENALKKNKLNAVLHYPLYLFKLIIFDKMGLYATSPIRVFTSLLLVYIIISLNYLILPFFLDTSINCIKEDSSFLYRALDTFYYSMITFGTVGYGDCSPVGFLRFVASVEAFVGPFMMSYFTVAFARKILR